VNWDEEFLQQSRSLETNSGESVTDPVLVESDELSRTAGLLVESLKSEENPKFQNSAFMVFMRQIRDKQMVVDGDKIVASSEANLTASTNAATTKSMSTTPVASSSASPVIRERSLTTDGWPMKSVHFKPMTTTDEPTGDLEQAETGEDTYWEAENRDYREYWEKTTPTSTAAAPPAHPMRTPQQREWDTLQESWNTWEATATGVKHTAAENYPFQTDNPYVFDDRSGTRGINELEQVSDS